MSSSRVSKVLLAIEGPLDRNKYFHHLVPLGPLGIVSFLESKGVRTDLVDMNVTKEFPDVSEYDAVGFSVTNSNITPTLKRIRFLREELPEMKLFAGGPEAMADPNFLYDQSPLDAVIVGEAESVIYKYLRAADPGNIPGLVLRGKDGKTYHTGRQEWLQSLDSLPFPALDCLDLSRYGSPLRKEQPFSSIITSRGCPWRCTFCFHSQGYQWRARSAHNVADEIEWQVKRLGVREIAIQDDHFTHDKVRVSKICREIRERDIDVHLQLPLGIRVDSVSRGLLKELRGVGMWLIAIAPESGNPATLQRINKGFSLERVKEVGDWCRQLGIATWALFILGFPWEGEPEVDNTIRFAQELDADITQFTRLTLFPGTPLYEEFSQGSCEYRDLGFFHGDRESPEWDKERDERFLQRSLNRAYHSTVLRPKSLLRLMRTLPLSSLVHSARFALATGNI